MSVHEDLLLDLKRRWPDIEVRVHVLPKVAWIDIRLDSKTLVIECSTDGVFGMSVVPDGSADIGGHDAEYTSRDDLVSAVETVLSTA